MGAVQEQENEIVSLSGIKLNVYVMLLTIPLWLISSASYIWLFGLSNYFNGVYNVLNIKIFILLLLGIPVHELLHAFTWMLLQKEGFKNITFGFNWESLTPYTHYTNTMVMWKYRWGGAVPGLLMGVIPVLLSFIFVHASLNFVGFLFCWAALGDAISLFMTRKYKAHQVVQDHPTKLGVFIID